jgi:hypothetical protein
MEQLNGFSKIDFTCDSCRGEFEQKVAYSVAQSWEELDDNYTYCEGCVEKENKPKKQKNWGSAPVNEVSENVQSLNIDRRSLRKTVRVHLFATRVRKE